MANIPGGPEGPTSLTPSRGTERSSGHRAVIGAATAVRGQIAAREDLWIEGQFDGEIQAAAHQLTVGAGGRVRADVKARTVVVEGELQGNVAAEQMVLVRAGGRMLGDIQAPRVGLEEGCHFRGNVDMTPGAAAATAASTPAETASAALTAPPAIDAETAPVGERRS
ncbi:MAG TPA: polymer-forming cytoskeletal protein [Thermoanaerobaculia bacterium]|jgi:cytoskeletal protein CcmA (bactofilin family)|nr:polymer-forming cytoskeletal protein [Thermoanaerobaculia bacterium]